MIYGYKYFTISPYAIVGRFSESPMHFVFKYPFFERNSPPPANSLYNFA